MKKVIFSFLFFLCPILASAQVQESDSLNVKADLSLTGFWQSGNVETLIFRAKSGFSVKAWNKWVFESKNSYVYQEFGREKADEDILSLNFLYFNPRQKIYPQLLAFVSTNFRRDIDLRYLLGAGITIKLLDDKKNLLRFSVTSEYEQTDFGSTRFNRSRFNGSQSIDTFRGTIWINGKYQILEDKVIVTHESYYQPSLEQVDNYRWQADLGLEFPISKFLNFKINYLHTFENIVIVDQNQEDQFLTVGFTVKSY